MQNASTEKQAYIAEGFLAEMLSKAVHPGGHLHAPISRSGLATIAFPLNHFYSYVIDLLMGPITFRLLRQSCSVHIPHNAWLGKCLPHNAAHIRLWDNEKQLASSILSCLPLLAYKIHAGQSCSYNLIYTSPSLVMKYSLHIALLPLPFS